MPVQNLHYRVVQWWNGRPHTYAVQWRRTGLSPSLLTVCPCVFPVSCLSNRLLRDDVEFHFRDQTVLCSVIGIVNSDGQPLLST